MSDERCRSIVRACLKQAAHPVRLHNQIRGNVALLRLGVRDTHTLLSPPSVDSWRQRTPFPANVKAMASRRPLEGLGAAHGYALCEKDSCEAAEQ
eukprot:524918-Prymnesium_polylepis.1